MTKLAPLAYVVLLLAAFLIGLCGTLAASRAVASGMGRQPVQRIELPTSVPLSHPRGGHSSIDC